MGGWEKNKKNFRENNWVVHKKYEFDEGMNSHMVMCWFSIMLIARKKKRVSFKRINQLIKLK